MTERTRVSVLGSPIGHSLSPVLHRAAYDALGLAGWSYDAIECTADDLPATLDRLSATHAGVSLTMPLKRAVLPLLDEIDAPAHGVGAVNTVLFTDSGRRGANTDVAGLVAGLEELAVPLEGAGAVILGGGGTARAAVGALARCGLASVTVYVRDTARGAPLVAVGEAVGLPVVIETWSSAAAGISVADVVVATTPAGATDSLAGAGWRERVALVDVVYDPWPTKLAAAASGAGAPVTGGLSVLVGQAVEQVALMTGRTPPVEALREAGERALAARA